MVVGVVVVSLRILLKVAAADLPLANELSSSVLTTGTHYIGLVVFECYRDSNFVS